MKQKKTLYLLVAALLAVTAALAALYLSTRETIPEGAVKVTCGDKTACLTAEEAAQQSVTGEVVNGKGETKPVDTMGVPLGDALAALGLPVEDITLVTATAQDAYSAQLTGEELREAGRVYLTAEDGTLRLVVFGDSNAKRQIKNLAALAVTCG